MQIDFKGKKVLVRVDFNVPLDENYNITDDTRMQRALPTLKHILEHGGAVIIMSHLGRPMKKLKADGSIDKEKFTLHHTVDHLSSLLNRPVYFSSETVGEEPTSKAKALREGEVLVLENTRFYPGEKKGDESFAKQLAALGDVYVNDAFGTAHRAHASTTTVAKFFPADAKAFGFLMENEISQANKVLNNPSKPMAAIVGGAKVSDKILLLEKLLDAVDFLIVGGGMAYTFLKAQGGKIGSSLCEEDKLDLANQVLEKAKNKGVSMLLPFDSVVADQFSNDASHRICNSKEIEDGWMGLDIGPKAIKDFSEAIKKAKTILWNGPMGVFEMANFSSGTKSIALAVAESTQNGAFSLVGGGDSVAAVNQMGVSDQVSHVSTGGGAMLEYLEGKDLPGIKAIQD